MALHYICPGSCRGVSSVPKSCESETCSNYREPLEECDCSEGHEQNINSANDQSGEESGTEESS